MKKLVIILFAILFVNLSLAEPVFELNKENFQPGETVLGQLSFGNSSGEFVKTISLNDVKFFKGQKQVFFDYDIVFYNGLWFFYAYAVREGDFVVKIENILYKDGELKSATIEKEFVVEKAVVEENETQKGVISIKPGFVFSSQIPELSIKNLGAVGLDVSYLEGSVKLSVGEIKKISYTPEEGLSYLVISCYDDFEIPIIYLPLNSEDENVSEKLESNLKPKPSHLQVKVIQGERHEEIIELVNFGLTNITNVEFLSRFSILEVDRIGEIPAKSIYNLTLSFYSDKTGFFKENLSIGFTENEKENSLIVPLEIYVFPENSTSEDFEDTEKTCDELEGVVCGDNQECSGDYTFAYGAVYCCLGICEDKKKETGSWGWVWGVVIFIVLAVVGYFVYKKIKKTKPKKVEEVLKQSSKAYESRVKGKLSKF